MRRGLTALTLVVALLAGCAEGPALVGVGDPLVDGRLLPGASSHTIFTITTRALSEDPTEYFGGERSEAPLFASTAVVVPPEREPGTLTLPDTLPPDPRTDFIIAAPMSYGSEEAFRQAIDAALARRPPGERRILLFVHGYNTTFSAATARLAQFVEDTGYRGVPVLFSWPSEGRTIAYVHDINSAMAVRDHLAEVKDVLNATDAQTYDVLAHSMGNLLVMETLRTLSLTGDFNRLGRLGIVILAAPDIDLDLFVNQLRAVPPERRRFTVLISRDDRALAVSRRIAGGVPRVGNAPPDELAELGVTVIDLSEVQDPTSLHHDKFASAPEVVQLIGQAFTRYGGIHTARDRTPLADLAGNVVDVITFAPR